MTERISPPAELEHVLDDLRSDGVFETKQKAIMFAASVGRALNRSPREPGKQGEGIRFEYFERVRDASFIDALAVTADADLSVLAQSREEARVALFEKYASDGLAEMKKACYESGLNPLEGVLLLVDRLCAQAAPKQGALGLGADISRLKDLL